MRSSSFFGALFDFSFTEFVTTRMISVIYRVQVGIGALLALAVALYAFTEEGMFSALMMSVVAAIGFVLWCVVCRISLEFAASLFRAVEVLVQIRDRDRAADAPTAAPLV